MTDGTGRIDQLTADQISRLTVKGGGRVPTLEQVLASLRQRSARLLLEIKGPQSPAHVEKTLELVTEAGMAERTMIQSFDEDVVRNAAASAHGMKVALLRDKLDPDPVATARKFSLTAYSIAYKGLATVDRMTDGTGRIDQLTADQISRLTVKGGGRVPTLEQVLASLRQRSARLLLEIKGPQSPAHVEKTLELVTEAGMAERTMIQSFDEDVVRNAAASAHGMKVALLRDKLDPDPVATARKFSLTAYSIAYKGLAARPTALDQLKAAGIDVFVWTVDREPDWQTATTWGVDGIITNRPDVLLQWRKSHCTEPSLTPGRTDAR
ncbi:glycerophosphodiester phosphodiesterase family protein [Streptomyces chrestomyceticus]